MNHLENYIGTPWGMVICIDEYQQNGAATGRLYHRYQKNPSVFYELTQALLMMEEVFDRIGYPFSGTENRYFNTKMPPHRQQQKIKRKLSDEEMLNNNGDKGTFIVRVEQRQHSSWQGRVTWVEENKTVSFRSALELIKLMDGALEEASAQTEASEHREETV